MITAWVGERLVGLIRALDDGEMMAFAHYLLVHPDYQCNGIAARLVVLLKEKYRDYLFFNIMPDEKKNVAFYEKFGFKILEEGTAMQLKNIG